MNSECFPFIKYIYIGILFVFVFIVLYSQHLQLAGYGSLFGLQTILTAMVSFDLFMDNDRSEKALTMKVPSTPFMKSYLVKIEYWWVILLSVVLQFVSSLLMLLTWTFLSKREKNVSLSKKNQGKINMFKLFSLIITYALLLMLLSYFYQFNGLEDTNNFSGGYKTIIILIYLLLFILPIININNANELSKLRFTVTDG